MAKKKPLDIPSQAEVVKLFLMKQKKKPLGSSSQAEVVEMFLIGWTAWNETRAGKLVSLGFQLVSCGTKGGIITGTIIGKWDEGNLLIGGWDSSELHPDSESEHWRVTKGHRTLLRRVAISRGIPFIES